ncbi:MAG: sigma-70 family RNA polymerase sigma factor [Ignavibacteriales bacterium]|jgi:RNA polymerase sigma-70 factor (ECF subfamily)|nr:sigma-70 family RNA polymerase sigma factor [Ignavibacteriales bacterium]MBP9120867.1 sigma-70 family RNA polymerase sigma factor [Ignavibacterium sp.]
MDYEQNENMQQPKILSLDDDFSLIKQFIDGDESVFSELLKRHKEKVRNIIYLTLSNSDGVDDIAQEVFITVYRHLKSFRFESQFTTWLYRITINKCKDHLRKKNIRSIFLPLKDEEPVFESINEDTDIKHIVRNAIATLPDKLRIPLVLKDLEGFSYQEIADTMECEIGTVKSRIFRAREALKKILKPLEKELML